MKNIENDIRKLEDLEDGSSVYEVGEALPDETIDEDFNKNLASFIPESDLKKISSYLLDAIKEDIEARKEWMDVVEKSKEYLGFSLENLKDLPFKEATKTFDSTLATALIRFYATTRAELLPAAGPAGFRVVGDDNEAAQEKGKNRTEWLNYYLTVKDGSYYPDFEKFLLYLGLYGSAFKKVYYDTILQRPLSRFIAPTDFVVNGDCTSIIESTRITHILHLSKREILLNQQAGIYRDIELKHLGILGDTNDDNDEETKDKKDDIDLGAYSKRSLFPIYEVHAYLNLDDFTDSFKKKEEENIPSPYVVSIDKISGEILYIRRNWKEDDAERKRINYFVQYNYLPGFGIYGLGLAHLIGSNAINLTTILRQLVDAGKFQNLPGGIRAKGLSQQKTNMIVGPGEWIEVDTGGVPPREAFLPLPYSGPSQALRELRLEIQDQTRELASTSEMGMLESREDIPVGTAIAFLETNNRIQSAVLRSVHYSLTQELQLIDSIFKGNLDKVDIQGYAISYNDFEDKNVEIIPVSDPTVNSTVQRIMKAQASMQLAQQAPELHDMREVFKLSYKAQGLNDNEIDKILKPEPEEEAEVMPLDPISENINALKELPLKAAIWQEHAAHKMMHGLFAQQYPELQPALMAHIKEHDAFEYLIKMQQLLGTDLPPLEMLHDPEIQNAIAMAIAGVAEDSEQVQEPAPLDPNAVWMADIQAKQAETEAKERIATQKTETDIFKVQLDFEKEKAKIESNEDIAKLKSETDLMKYNNN